MTFYCPGAVPGSEFTQSHNMAIRLVRSRSLFYDQAILQAVGSLAGPLLATAYFVLGSRGEKYRLEKELSCGSAAGEFQIQCPHVSMK